MKLSFLPLTSYTMRWARIRAKSQMQVKELKRVSPVQAIQN
jgi:hypothetical protein